MPTASPWSSVSAAAYEAWLGSGDVGELPILAAIFARVYAARRPRRVALPGLGTGDGLACVDVRTTGRVVGIDPNLGFLAVARQRHLRLGAALQLHCSTVEDVELPAASFDLVHASRVLEWCDLDAALPRLAAWVAPGGALSLVVRVGRTPPPADASLAGVAEAERDLLPGDLRERLTAVGIAERRAFLLALPGGGRLLVVLGEAAPTTLPARQDHPGTLRPGASPVRE